jgi:PAS domain S-box-containing protein
MTQWSEEFLRGVLDAAPEGIVVCESRPPDQIAVFVNGAFERLTGYSRDELLGQDLRKLQAWDREQEGRTQLREAITRGESTRAVLRNYRKDGNAYWNEVLIQPMRGARQGDALHRISS